MAQRLMGAIWIHDLPSIVRRAGVEVRTWPGWEWRSRSSGGYDSILGVGIHHDAWPAGRSLEQRCRYAWEQAAGRPIGAMWAHTDGSFMIGAAGATNTQGRGGPYRTSKGTIPKDAGNRHVISIEASNNGVGEVWPQVQQEAMLAVAAELCREFGLAPGDVFGHFEWAPGRKIDPFGPSFFTAGRNEMWNMDLFRLGVLDRLRPPAPPDLPGANVFHPIAPYRNSDTRVFGGAGIDPGKDHRFGLDPAKIPRNAKAVAMMVACVSDRPGWCDVRPDGQPFLGTSTVNFRGKQGAASADNGSATIGIRDLHFNVRLSQRAHVIIDVTGYWT